MAETPVVTAFLEDPGGRVLVLRRAEAASTYPGRWAGVSGYLEGDDPLVHAYAELAEETGLERDDLPLLAAGRPLSADGWLVYPFLFRCADTEALRLNEEHAEASWVEPSTLLDLETVPALAQAYAHTKVAEAVAAIGADETHGAGFLARQAVDALIAAAQLGADPLEAGRALAGARPAMGAIAGAVGRVLAAARTPEQVREEGQAVVAASDRAGRSIAILLDPELHGVVMTHSASATVREALLHARPVRVVCTASEPQGEGRRFAAELAREGLTVEVVADGDAAHAATTVDLVLVGADSVFRDGTLVNKAGTRKLAEAAKEARRPFVVACETFKLAPYGPREPDEELFDLTPPELIGRYVTEEGVFAPDEVAALVDRTPFLRDGYALLRGEA